MPYARRKFIRRRRPVRYRRYGGGKRLVKTIRRVINRQAEKKYFDYSANTTVSNSGYLLKLSEVPQGDSDVSRDGDQLTIRSLQFNTETLVGVNETGGTNKVRIIIFQWFPNTAAGYPTLNNLLLDVTSPFLSPYAHDYRFNFRILADRTASVDDGDPSRMMKFFIRRFARRKIQYVGASATSYTNGLFAYLVSDSGAIPHPTVYWSGKLNYSDT